jgi:hypothetical protein
MPNSNISPFGDNQWVRRFTLNENARLLGVAVHDIRVVISRWYLQVGDLPCPHQRGIIST